MQHRSVLFSQDKAGYNRHMAHARNTKKLTEVYDLLYAHYGPQHWWPGDTDVEVITGAILTQNTSWGNVAKAIVNLKGETELELGPLLAIPEERLAELIRPSGYYRQKAARLRGFFVWLGSLNSGDWRTWLKKKPLNEARDALLAVHGIGPETADSILLYGADRKTFVIDKYTLRFGARYGLYGEKTKYQEARAYFMDHLPHSAKLYNEYHALIVRLGATFCKSKPLCTHCPLNQTCRAGKKDLKHLKPHGNI